MRMRLKRYVDAIGVHETSIMQYMEDYGMKSVSYTHLRAHET